MSAFLSSSLLSWLRCFEAAARHASFTRAAEELHITQGAVSQQVKRLEEWLELPLFNRMPRSLMLTAEGERLQNVVMNSFQSLETTLSQLRRHKTERPLHLSCYPSFAMLWLMPRLGEFLQSHPKLGLRVFAEFHALNQARMAQEGIEVAIRFDTGNYTNLKVVKFLDEWLFPVASPGFVAAHPEITAPRDLPGSLLLHDAIPWAGAGEYEEWNTWLNGAGVQIPDIQEGQRFNLSQLAISAALGGQGIAIGRSALIMEDIMNGRLVDLFGLFVQSRAAYYFISAKEISGQIGEIVEWLIAEGRAFHHQRMERLGKNGASAVISAI